MKVSGARKKRRATKRPPELRRYGRVKWVPVQQVEPVHSVRYPHHLARLVRSMRRRMSSGCMWNGRPLLVERVRPSARHPGIRWIAWTGSHRIAAAFAAGQWLIPIIEINAKLYDRIHGKPGTVRLSETYDDESRLARLLATKDKRAIRLMDKEVPRADKAKRDRRNRSKTPEKDTRPWTSLGGKLEARTAGRHLVDLRNKASGDTFIFHREVLMRTLAVLDGKPLRSAGRPRRTSRKGSRKAA